MSTKLTPTLLERMALRLAIEMKRVELASLRIGERATFAELAADATVVASVFDVVLVAGKMLNEHTAELKSLLNQEEEADTAEIKKRMADLTEADRCCQVTVWRCDCCCPEVPNLRGDYLSGLYRVS